MKQWKSMDGIAQFSLPIEFPIQCHFIENVWLNWAPNRQMRDVFFLFIAYINCAFSLPTFFLFSFVQYHHQFVSNNAQFATLSISFILFFFVNNNQISLFVELLAIIRLLSLFLRTFKLGIELFTDSIQKAMRKFLRFYVASFNPHNCVSS